MAYNVLCTGGELGPEGTEGEFANASDALQFAKAARLRGGELVDVTFQVNGKSATALELSETIATQKAAAR